ncbi:NADH dehydrogenase [ubiquinone] 1 alpha subcomplex assembly factor 7, partial [Tremellales sp. Uapishka_1]
MTPSPESRSAGTSLPDPVSSASLDPSAPSPPLGKLAKIIRDSIKATGPIPISRYMQFCLSHPTEGYYSKGDVFGKQGDFITSPEISQVFGELVAIWLLTRYMAAGSPPSVRLVELGPGRGTLMDDVLRTLSTFPGISKAIRSVYLIDNSEKMQELQKLKLEPRIQGRDIELKWSDRVEDVPQSNEFTMVIAHEFFDAMPINLFEKTDEGFREVYVDADPSPTPTTPSGLRLALSRTASTLSDLLPTFSKRFDALPLGARVEISQENFKVMRAIGTLLNGGGGGVGLLVDYGDDKCFENSFRAFRDHEIVDIFHEPGTADLTANVDFAYLKESLQGIARPLGPVTQSHFLQSLGLQPRLMTLISSATSEKRREDIEKGARRLIDMEGMGGQYKVLGVIGGTGSTDEVYPFPVGEAVEQVTRGAEEAKEEAVVDTPSEAKQGSTD